MHYNTLLKYQNYTNMAHHPILKSTITLTKFPKSTLYLQRAWHIHTVIKHPALRVDRQLRPANHPVRGTKRGWGLVSCEERQVQRVSPELSLSAAATNLFYCLGVLLPTSSALSHKPLPLSSSPRAPLPCSWFLSLYFYLKVFWSCLSVCVKKRPGCQHAVVCEVWVRGLPSGEDQLHRPGRRESGFKCWNQMFVSEKE